MPSLTDNFVARILRRKVPTYYFLITVIATVLIMNWKDAISERVFHFAEIAKPVPAPTTCPQGLVMTRLRQFKYTAPLLMTDTRDEDRDMADLKSRLFTYIEQQKTTGQVADASVYIRKVSNGGWIEVNGTAAYKPGSMAKMAILIAWLKMSEKDPSVLNRTYTLTPGAYQPIQQFYPGKEIEAGKPYTVKELLRYMICESANSATMLLSNNLNQQVFSNVFTDLGLPQVTPTTSDYPMTAEGISKFLRVLFNSSYVGADLSEYALSLLSQSEFKLGITHYLPQQTKVSHKFGEAGDPQFTQLHETGIVYANDNTYLITVMTKGKKTDQLASCIATISQMTYQSLVTSSN